MNCHTFRIGEYQRRFTFPQEHGIGARAGILCKAQFDQWLAGMAYSFCCECCQHGLSNSGCARREMARGLTPQASECALQLADPLAGLTREPKGAQQLTPRLHAHQSARH